jgi:ribosomal protein S18 acetylase RimI-like enzyme
MEAQPPLNQSPAAAEQDTASLRDIVIRRLGAGDATALRDFYNRLTARSLRLFHPLGPSTDEAVCQELVAANDPSAVEARYDLIAASAPQIVGWCFLQGIDGAEPSLGLCIADLYQGLGLGTRLIGRVMQEARRRSFERITLIVVEENEIAQTLYRREGFRAYGRFTSEDDGLPYIRMQAH